MATPIAVTDQEFEPAVLKSDTLVMVDFWATRSTPTIIFFRAGQEVERIVGARRKAHYTNKLDALLG